MKVPARFSLPVRLTLTRRGWGFVLAAVALFIGWMLLELRDIWYLMVLLLSIVFTCAIVALLPAILAKVRVRVSVSNPTPVVGETITVSGLVEHRLPVSFPGNLIWEIASKSLPASPGGSPVFRVNKTTRFSHHYTCSRRGPQLVKVLALTVIDPLGIATVRMSVKAETNLLVLPNTLDSLMESLTSGGSLQDLDGLPAAQIITDDTSAPGGAVRSYRSGDAPRQIHWKQSARQGELLVNLQESVPRANQSLLLLIDQKSYATAHVFEGAVAAAATIGCWWIRQGNAVNLHIGTQPPQVCSTENEVLRLLAHVMPQTKTSTPAAFQHSETPATVVAGTVTASIAQILNQGNNGGQIIALNLEVGVNIPHGWKSIALEPHLSQVTAHG